MHICIYIYLFIYVSHIESAYIYIRAIHASLIAHCYAAHLGGHGTFANCRLHHKTLNKRVCLKTHSAVMLKICQFVLKI